MARHRDSVNNGAEYVQTGCLGVLGGAVVVGGLREQFVNLAPPQEVQAPVVAAAAVESELLLHLPWAPFPSSHPCGPSFRVHFCSQAS